MDDKNGIGGMRMQENLVCAKMSDERGVNGESKIASGEESPRNGISETATTTNGAFSQKSVVQADAGGRLRFFKDGKLIMELSHHEGERASWVPVAKKTYWPPRGRCSSLAPVAVAGSSRQESSTSFSVSDDNSSVQSSPWQRDHCWKQSLPRKDAGRSLTFLMRSDGSVKSARLRYSLALKRMSRRPLENVVLKEDPVSGGKRLTKVTREKVLKDLVEKLLAKAEAKANAECNAEANAEVNAEANAEAKAEAKKPSPAPAYSKVDHSVVSPRKRILKEFGRVTLEDQNNKRHKKPTAVAPVLSPSPPLGPHINSIRTKGSYTVPASTPSPSSSPSPSASSKCKERLGSYSISSLLAKPDDEAPFLRSLLKSPPHSDQGSSGSSPSCVSSPQSPGEVRLRPSKKKVSSPDPPPSHPLSYHPAISSCFPPFPPPPMAFFHPSRYMWPYPLAQNLNYPSAANLMPVGVRAMWTHPLLEPTAPIPAPQFCVDSRKGEELAADVPLNLSKNAG